MKQIVLFTALFLFIPFIVSSNVEITTSLNAEITVCDASKTFEVKVKNNSGNQIITPDIIIKLPTGIEYIHASLSETSSHSVSEVDVSQDSELQFQSNTIPIGDSLLFSIDYRASGSAVNFQSTGGVFRNTVIVDHLLSSDTIITTSYNILYPELSILQVDPSAYTFTSGNSMNRNIQLINGGTGRTNRVVVMDVRNSGLLGLDSVSIGRLSGDSIIVEGSDFNTIGNGDNYLDQNESFSITEYLSGTSCSDLTVTSSINASWGCDGETFSSSTSYGNATIDFNNPNLKLIASESLEACFGAGVASAQELRITNTGSGISNGGSVEIFKATGSSYNQSIFSRFDEQSFTSQIGQAGTPTTIQSLTTTATLNTGDYACLGSNPIGRVEFNIPDLQPGDTLIIKWDMYSCCLQSCSNDAVKGWRAELAYTDVCGISPYTKTLNGQSENEQYASFFTESPTDIEDGEEKDFHFIVSSFENTLPQGNVAAYQATFSLDNGLKYKAIRFHSNGQNWTPIAVNYNISSNQVTALFPPNAPFTVTKSLIDLTLEGECGSSGWKDIELNFSYLPDTTCNTSCAIPLACEVQTSTYLYCPSGNCDALEVLDFSIKRTNFGLADNNLDGAADASGVLDMTEVKDNRAMVGDTILGQAKGFIGTNSTTWDYASFTSSVDFGSVLAFIDATLEIYDASSGTTHTVTGLTPTITTSNNERDFTFDLSVANLVSLNSALTGYSYASSDSIQLDVRYRVESSVASLIKETTFTNEFYLSEFANPTSGQKESCNFKNGRITLIGYAWRNDSPNNLTVTSCSRSINQYFGLSIGDQSSNYAGGNLFPYEFRQWAHLKEFKVVIPPNYSHVNTVFNYYRTRNTNSTITQRISGIAPTSINGDTLYYDIEQYISSGQYTKGDDGFHGRINIEIAPNCDVPENTFQNVHWFFNYQKSAAIDEAETDYLSASSPDRIRFRRPTLNLSSTNPWQDANQRSVIWDYKVENTSSSGAQNAWMHLKVPPNIVIDSIVNDNTGERLDLQNDIYLIGTINSGSTADLSVHGTFSNCDSILILSYSGYECIGYPSDFASFQCPYEFMPLYVEPKQSAYQPRLTTNLMADPCDTQIELVLDITSTKIAHMYDMSIELISPDSSKIKVLSGSSEFQYNASSPYTGIADPSYNSGTYTYTINNYESSFTNDGIPGVLDLANNNYKLKLLLKLGTSFVQGDFLGIQINGKNACAEDLPTINLAYDPNVSFAKDNTAGLHIDINNSWSASWGDYDNDGYDDLFVPSRDVNQTSFLYKNNQDGTFTKVTSGSIVTDLGASISGSWGDYDNDGDLDLFVANSENSSNRLYKNNGDGTFTSILSGKIITEGVYSHSAAWADYNKDGFLDLVVSDFHPTDFNVLYYGDGQGNFEVDASSPISQSATSAVGVAWGDYDNDRDPDLFIANTNGENNQLFRNDAGVFTEITSGDIVNDGGTSVGGAWGDYDNDGDLDLFVTNSSIQDPNFFYENNGDGTFTKILSGTLVSNISNSHGASWIDYDNDGDQDLLVANDQGRKNYLFSNNGDKTFSKLENAITEDAGDSYGTAWSDYDNDGDYDLFIANTGTNANDFFINEKGSCTNHLIVKLQGCMSNSQGVGALVRLKSTIYGKTLWQTKHVSTQTSAMGGQNSSKLLFGLGDASSVDSLVVFWPSGMETVITNPTINQKHTINESCGAMVCGSVYYDENSNGIQDSSEIGIPNRRVLLTPGDYEAFTDVDGNFKLYLEDGTYTLGLQSSPDWSQTAPAQDYTFTVNYSQSNTYCGKDFANTPVCNSPSLTASIGATAFRRGLRNDLNITVSNIGASDATDLIELELTTSDKIALLSNDWTLSSSPTGYHIYTYSFSQLGALQDTVFQLTDSVSVASDLDETITIDLKVSYLSTECDTTDNTSGITDIVVGSLDPNDKLVFVGRTGKSLYASRTDKLWYKIRFQNVGTYSAQRVYIVDTLDHLLDWETFQVESSSHPMKVARKGRVVSWLNSNIELPDSATNEEESNGFVLFSIYPKKSTKVYDLIRNRAGIQFDYNDYVITNTVRTIIASESDMARIRQLHVYPNPASSTVQIKMLDNEFAAMHISKVYINDSYGKRVLEEYVEQTLPQIDISDLPAGSYVVHAVSQDGRNLKAILVKI